MFLVEEQQQPLECVLYLIPLSALKSRLYLACVPSVLCLLCRPPVWLFEYVPLSWHGSSLSSMAFVNKDTIRQPHTLPLQSVYQRFSPVYILLPTCNPWSYVSVCWSLICTRPSKFCRYTLAGIANSSIITSVYAWLHNMAHHSYFKVFSSVIRAYDIQYSYSCINFQLCK